VIRDKRISISAASAKCPASPTAAITCVWPFSQQDRVNRRLTLLSAKRPELSDQPPKASGWRGKGRTKAGASDARNKMLLAGRGSTR